MRTLGKHQQSKNATTLFFTGGGTGGHVYPGIAVYDSFLQMAANRNLEVEGVWIGSRRGMERELVESRGIGYIGIPSGKLRRYFSARNLADIFKVFFGILSAYGIIVRYRPAALFSKGGYVSVPPVVAAWLAKVPVITHESDLDPGLATRINARFAAKVLLSFNKTSEYFADALKDKLVTTGNPVRPEVVAGEASRGKKILSFSGKKPILLALGGSQGARGVNSLIWNALETLLESWNVVHQTGVDDSGPPGDAGYKRYAYIHEEYPDILAAADLVVCRAGATTLWELAALKKPSILLPLSANVSRGDQVRNAELFNQHGASYILPDGTASDLMKYTDSFVSEPDRLIRMGEAAAAVYKPGAAEEIAAILLKIVFGEKLDER